MIDPHLRSVRLRSDRYDHEGVKSGAIGGVVENRGDDFYEVGFSDEATGETIALLTLPSNAVELLEDRAAIAAALRSH